MAKKYFSKFSFPKPPGLRLHYKYLIWGMKNISNPWNGQKWFWGDFMGLFYSPWHEAWQDHQTCHMWHDRIFLEFLVNISFVNIAKAWNIQNGFLRDLTNILNMTMCWNSYIWEIYAPWVSLIFVKYFWNNKIIFPY